MPFVVVNARVMRDNTGATMIIPALLSPDGLIRPLIDYCISVRRSVSWQNKLLRAVKLFLEYLEVNAIEGEEEWRVFRNFSKALRGGSIDLETREDPSGLYWEGVDGRDADYLITLLSDFFDWLGREESPGALKFNPRYPGNSYDQRIDLKAFQYRRGKAFLGHAWSPKPVETNGRYTRSANVPMVFPKQPPMFPEERFEELLFKGFKVAGEYDYRGILITLLLFGGALRISEPFHLFMADVQPHWDDSEVAFVAVHHPSLGIAPNNWTNSSGRRGSRAEYLAAEYGLMPRDVVRGKKHAGWKHPALDDHWFMQVHWFPENYGRWFMQIWALYMENVASIPRNHPYAWVNLDREPVGGIYTISSYNKALEAAIERIGLTFGKVYGTTAHGPRHAYAQRARRAGIDPIVIQRLMHHCSPESQKVYTQPELREAVSAIREATNRLGDKSSQIPSLLTL